MNRPAPVEITYENMRFLITHNPTNATLSKFIEVRQPNAVLSFPVRSQVLGKHLSSPPLPQSFGYMLHETEGGFVFNIFFMFSCQYEKRIHQ